MATDRVTMSASATDKAPMPLREVFDVSTHWPRSLVGSPVRHARTASYGGDTGLWPRVEAARQWWNEQGRPAQDRFGYAREPEGAVRVWHILTGRRWNL